jgi:glycosyltransferase involved in cell wall biosynthesis
MIAKLEGTKRQHSESAVPLVSIITVVFRARAELKELIENISRFKDDKIEFIVVDGGSDDGTVELLKQYDSVIDYWISESDKGIYDAMNKGVAAAKGTFLLHLNAGDRLLYIPMPELEAAALNNTDIVAFRVSIDGEREFRPRSGLALRLKNTLHHQGTFFRREGFPVYDLSYKVFGDFDVNQRLARRGAHVEIFDRLVATHMGGGLSDVHTQQNVTEFFQVIYRNYGWTHLPPAWLICKWRGLKTRVSRILQNA